MNLQPPRPLAAAIARSGNVHVWRNPDGGLLIAKYYRATAKNPHGERWAILGDIRSDDITQRQRADLETALRAILPNWKALMAPPAPRQETLVVTGAEPCADERSAGLTVAGEGG